MADGTVPKPAGRTIMRRFTKAALLAAALVTGGAIAAPTAGADTGNPNPPSCSLHPDRNVDGTVTFTKDPAKDVGNDRFLQAFNADDDLVFNDWLSGGESTGPLPAVRVIWSGHAYPVSAYADVDWCGAAAEPAPTTTTTEAPAPPTTEAPAPTTTTVADMPAATTTTVEAEPVTLAPAAVGVAGVVVTRAEPVAAAEVVEADSLAVTGTSSTPWMAAAAAALIAAGVGLVARTRRLARREPTA